MLTGNLAGSSNVASTGGDKSHHDPLGMQGETAAARSPIVAPPSPHHTMKRYNFNMIPL
ncbi:hypothetical protein SLEP1_g53017 [Rubroshorea leprosula]|uniref:Uncharacterized protein n=1 Tax=Rubroshorea leprosula TaxID=152421 RepID=A0AAV5M836_9ROSI|nr:hypothetical protein SLEP1_g53017 [Rubroshorea leprosula]